MGLRLEVYNDNFVGLVADFTYIQPSSDFIPSDSVEQAMKYFNLYLDDNTLRLKRNDPNQRIIDKLGINSENVDTFLANLNNIGNILTDNQALANPLLIATWKLDQEYEIGDKVRHVDIIWKALQQHTSNLENAPSTSEGYWTQVLPEIEPEFTPEEKVDSNLETETGTDSEVTTKDMPIPGEEPEPDLTEDEDQDPQTILDNILKEEGNE